MLARSRFVSSSLTGATSASTSPPPSQPLCRIVLASNSPRRKELLQQLLCCNSPTISQQTLFDVVPSSFDEKLDKDSFESAGLYAQATGTYVISNARSRRQHETLCHASCGEFSMPLYFVLDVFMTPLFACL